VNLGPQQYDLIAAIFAAATFFSATVVFQPTLVSVNVEAQNDDQLTSNGNQGSESGKGETFIVTLKNQTSSADLDDLVKSVEEKGAKVTHVYNQSLNGFSVQIPADKKTEIMYALVADVRIDNIEPDQTMTIPPPLE
jgi:hypothetical protein